MNLDGPPAGDFVAVLVSEMQGVLGDDLVGLYLYGSSVSAGFDPGVSDIDLLAVTSPEVEALDLAGLEWMQNALVSRYPEWSDRLEIVYIGRATLESFRTSPGSLAVISPGEPFHVRHERAAEWLQNWYLVRETGVRLYGAEAAAIVPPIAWIEFVAATVRYADELRDRSRLGVGGGVIAYTILTMCRRSAPLGRGRTARSKRRQRGLANGCPNGPRSSMRRSSVGYRVGRSASRMSGRALPRRLSSPFLPPRSLPVSPTGRDAQTPGGWPGVGLGGRAPGWSHDLSPRRRESRGRQGPSQFGRRSHSSLPDHIQ